MITPTDILQTTIASALIIACGYCIWNGRKVMRIWIEQGSKVNQVDWKDDDNNPANWYLKNPNKFKAMK